MAPGSITFERTSLEGGEPFEVTEDVLRAQLAVDLAPELECGILESGEGGTIASHQLKFDESMEIDECIENCDSLFECGQCHTEIQYPEEDAREYLRSDITDRCICPVLADHDCLRNIKGVEEGSLVVEITVPDRKELRSAIAGMRDAGASVSVRWMAARDTEETTAEIDVSAITPKQEEAVKHALAAGYYDTPRKISLGELAEDLGISESAVSQRLNNAEANLVRALFDGNCDDCRS